MRTFKKDDKIIHSKEEGFPVRYERNELEYILPDKLMIKREYGFNQSVCTVTELIKCLEYAKEKYGEGYVIFTSNDMVPVFDGITVAEEKINDSITNILIGLG